MQPQNARNKKQQQYYIFPHQTDPHQATWLQWPHQHTYGKKYRIDLEPIWIQMTRALSRSEIVRIIAYDEEHKEKIEEKLTGVENLEFFVWQTDDVWVRDNGPIFVRDRNGKLMIQNWGFNGWGGKTKYKKCAEIPYLIGQTLGFKVINLTQQMVNEGGSVQVDGNGVLIACQSSILNNNRNKGLRKIDAEQLFAIYYGVEKFIWLRGVPGQDITDFHIDGFVKFVDSQTMITMSQSDLQEWGVSDSDMDILLSATNIDNRPYNIITLPLTKNKLQMQDDQPCKGSYINFYIGNKVILLPIYNDPNDGIALEIVKGLYPGREVVGIQVGKLFAKGGMIHCVTQQQPVR